jgi:hypothetical protein
MVGSHRSSSGRQKRRSRKAKAADDARGDRPFLPASDPSAVVHAQLDGAPEAAATASPRRKRRQRKRGGRKFSRKAAVASDLSASVEMGAARQDVFPSPPRMLLQARGDSCATPDAPSGDKEREKVGEDLPVDPAPVATSAEATQSTPVVEAAAAVGLLEAPQRTSAQDESGPGERLHPAPILDLCAPDSLTVDRSHAVSELLVDEATPSSPLTASMTSVGSPATIVATAAPTMAALPPLAPSAARSPPPARFATPPIQFASRRWTVVHQVASRPPTVARPRTLGEFLAAAKLRADTLLLAPPVQ